MSNDRYTGLSGGGSLAERQRVAKLAMTLEYPDGKVVRFDGEHLMAEVRFDLARFGGAVIDAQDTPTALLPAEPNRLKVDITLDLHGKLTVSDGTGRPGTVTISRADLDALLAAAISGGAVPPSGAVSGEDATALLDRMRQQLEEGRRGGDDERG